MKATRVYLNQDELCEIWLSLSAGIISLKDFREGLSSSETNVDREAELDQNQLIKIRDKIQRARKKLLEKSRVVRHLDKRDKKAKK
jgi:hypothetical protein